jgi:hypothetical protein
MIGKIALKFRQAKIRAMLYGKNFRAFIFPFASVVSEKNIYS